METSYKELRNKWKRATYDELNEAAQSAGLKMEHRQEHFKVGDDHWETETDGNGNPWYSGDFSNPGNVIYSLVDPRYKILGSNEPTGFVEWAHVEYAHSLQKANETARKYLHSKIMEFAGTYDAESGEARYLEM